MGIFLESNRSIETKELFHEKGTKVFLCDYRFDFWGVFLFLLIINF